MMFSWQDSVQGSLRGLTVLILTVVLWGCGSGDSSDGTNGQAVAGAQASQDSSPDCSADSEAPECAEPPTPVASCAAGETPEGGRSYPVYLESASGETIAFQVLEPIGGIDCARGHPLVLHGHGFGGSRNTSGFEAYREAGFAVISIDQRGFGESSGTVRVMDPEFEGRDLIQILDWAETELDYLRKVQDPDLPRSLNPNLVVGAIGGSYGGGFQLLLHGQDPKKRLDALVPDITWNDLRYSLNPGGVIKTGWDLFLVAGGESGSLSNQNEGLDPIIREILAQGATTNRFPEAGLDFFYYHSPAYRCSGEPVSQDGMGDLLTMEIEPPAYDVAPEPYPPADILLTQGMTDTLFNFNDAWRNYQCLSKIGGDVLLMTHQSGHILPVEAPDELQPGTYADPTADLIEIPGFQGPAGEFACGDISISQATLDWLKHKLMNQPLPGYFDGSEDQVCLSTGNGQSVQVPVAEFPAPDQDGGLLTGQFVVERDVASSEPIANGYEAVATATTPPAALSLGLVGDSGAVIGGIPTAQLTVADLAGRSSCDPTLPEGSPGCDPIIFVGLGKKAADESRWSLIDDQIKPVRGLKDEAVVEFVGVAEELEPGTELALLVYGFHPQYPASWSRDALVPFVNVEGRVQVPVLSGALTN